MGRILERRGKEAQEIEKRKSPDTAVAGGADEGGTAITSIRLSRSS